MRAHRLPPPLPLLTRELADQAGRRRTYVLLVSDLSDGQIVLQKYAGRTALALTLNFLLHLVILVALRGLHLKQLRRAAETA